MLQDSEKMWARHFWDQYYFNKLVSEEEHTKFDAKIQLTLNKVYSVSLPMISPLIKIRGIKKSKIIRSSPRHLTKIVRFSGYSLKLVAQVRL